jgi:thioredoxin reductase
MTTDVAIVGAGPYGLSVASHLLGRGLSVRVFGTPMATWSDHMPKGMLLKSEGFATSLDDPSGDYTLAKHAALHKIPYADIGVPVSLDVFTNYGRSFQKRLVPGLEQQDVVGLRRAGPGYELTLADGATATAKRVVLAVGISHFASTPRQLAGLPEDLLSHSSRYHDLSRFRGQQVVVVGAGASALDCVAILCQAGASVQLVSRSPTVRFHAPPSGAPRPLLDRLRAPQSGLGPGWKSRLCTDAPLLFHVMPEKFRLKVVARHLGPAAGWWTQKIATEQAKMHLGADIVGARDAGGRAVIDLAMADGTSRSISADHVIAATGYDPLVSRLAFIDPALRASIKTLEGAPVLTASFESSSEGLYFTGLASSNDFGPLVRFVFGARFTARRVSRHIARNLPRQHPVVAVAAPEMKADMAAAA